MWKQTGPGESHQGLESASQAEALEATTFLTSSETLRPSLAPDAAVNGRLSFSRPTRLDGRLRGEVRSTDLLVIGKTGIVDGTVRAARVLILGRVLGDVLDAAFVEIGAGGELQGDVQASSFVVQEGGHFNGDCRISPRGRATVHILHPVRQELHEGGAMSPPGTEPRGTD